MKKGKTKQKINNKNLLADQILFPSSKILCFPSPLVTSVCGNKRRTGSLYKTWQTWGAQSETPIPSGPWVHTHHHMISDQSPVICTGTGLHWAGPPTLAVVSVITHSRVGVTKNEKHPTYLNTCTCIQRSCGERFEETTLKGNVERHGFQSLTEVQFHIFAVLQPQMYHYILLRFFLMTDW